MKILTIDIGTGTQDVFLYDSRLDIENGYKLVLPSPTMMVRQQVLAATPRHNDVFLTGRIMGGGPNSWAVEQHLKNGLRVFATPEAAKTFNDDLEICKQMGIILVSEEEGKKLPEHVVRIEMRDFDFSRLSKTFQSFGININDLAAVAVAVFDHGNAPADISDRKFRFDYLDQRIREQRRLSGFAYISMDIPESMTRMKGVADSANDLSMPLIVMDTAPAAVLGATYDPYFSQNDDVIVANMGNMHTLAFNLSKDEINGIFEHHTGTLNLTTFELLIEDLAHGTLTYEQVFENHGHGALVYKQGKLLIDKINLVVTGPRRNMVKNSRLQPHMAAPFGDMMLSGCYGLLSATADLLPEYSDEINASLSQNSNLDRSPWSVD